MKETTYSERISAIVSFLILFLLAFGLTATAFSQTVQPAHASKPMAVCSQPDGIRMHDGKVWRTEAGKTTLVEKEIVISGGTHIKPDGSVVTKSGYTAKLNEGDWINSTGKLIVADTKVVATNENADDEDEDEN